MLAPGWWESAATRRSCCPWESSGRPAHRVGRDRLADTAVHSECLQVRKRLLERKPLLVKIRARTPQLQGDLPSRLFSAADDRHDLLETSFVVRLQDLDAGGSVGKRPAMGREAQLRLEGGGTAEAIEIFVERILRALWVAPDV